MLFSAPIFLFGFLPLVLIFYHLLPKKISNIFLLLASILFYWWGESLFIKNILLMILLNFVIAQLISISKSTSRLFLYIGIFINLLFLIYYKYSGFIQQSFSNFLSTPSNINLIIPLAISFFIFHAISYLIDVYKKKIKPEKNIFHLSLYFLLFPHLLAGPIVRYKDIVKQIKKRTTSIDNLSYGIIRFTSGLAKKVLIADTISPIVDEIFATPTTGLMPTSALLGAIAYSIQIYFDFSGYSDMAIGLASMFGFKFPENFNYPYAARSLRDFWKRWHITLSNWFKDYLYIPLGGNRRSPLRNYSNLIIVFSLVGIWHGAGWSFVIWGLYQGIILGLERVALASKLLDKLNFPKAIGNIYLLTVVTLGWIFFRSDDLGYAFSFIRQIGNFLHPSSYQQAFHPTIYFLKPDVILALAFGSLLSFPSSTYLAISQKFKLNLLLSKLSILNQIKPTLSLLLLSILFLLSVITLSSQTYNPFIYFRF